MANNGEVLISSQDGEHLVKVTGRATFDCAPALRNLAKELENDTFSLIRVDLSRCEWMDSTFMGVLAMLGLRARTAKAVMEICGAGAQNTELLMGLGLGKLFLFRESGIEENGEWKDGADGSPVQMREGAETVLEAHKTLMGVDEQNVARFGKVVDLVQKDIDRMDSEKKQ